MLQRIPVSGWPLLVMAAWNGWLAPSSMPTTPGVMAIVMSLTTAIVAEACLAESATLCAVMVMAVSVGKICGAVYTPAVVMVPVAGLPPGTPLTLQETLALLVPVTVAVRVCVLPKSNEAVLGVMVTVMEEGLGGGGGGTIVGFTLPVLPAQPEVHAARARRVRIGRVATHGRAAVCDSLRVSSGRGRMKWRNAVEGPGTGERLGVRRFLRE